ncbi:hypothetical protein PHLCEN_2v10767 [Hermanssonia centrifuga]|uniref:Cytochrome P450 n=1 Tax=Hermanssonia centrifuga TaxID=98765 RepID=A0A2R6NM56_9APHY|nr:hypothetical protein PHLCEN_2v10767 [Hermanssonia centrifuga]
MPRFWVLLSAGPYDGRYAWQNHPTGQPIREAKGLYVYDPKALGNIIVKDQMIYEEPSWFISWNLMTMGAGLLSTLGDHHRKQRKMLNPVFSIAHMRHMTPLFYETTHRLRRAVTTQVAGGSSEVDILNWMSRTALELVGQGGLGYSFDLLEKDIPNPFGDALKRYLPLNFALQLWRMFSPYFTKCGPPGLRRFVAKFLPYSKMQQLREIVDTLDYQSRKVYNQKKVALEKGDAAVVQQIGEGKDIISILMQANMDASDEDRLPEDELIAQMSTLVFAATDTTSNALARTFHLLAEHPDVQEKIRAELLAVGGNDDIPYDQLVDLPYLDAVCRETLRLHPPVSFLSRETRADVVMPLSQPIHCVDGSIMNEIPVPKDTTVIIGIRGCNRNKAIWGEDALEWKPERWLSPLPKSVPDARVPGVYSNLMTFLGGGRACIGFKFSQLEMKVVLAVLLRSFRVTLSDKEIVWNLAGVNYPTVGREASRPSMPLKLEPINLA